jgi:(1->4)-alpha-D-glucan 1-alpha-D-glucosylmutase
VQLHGGFTFDDAAAIVPYLTRLGVSHLYCSPYLQAAAGSTHGYDVVDHSRIDDERGGANGHARLVATLDRAALGQVLDIVPNHMARDGRANRWWWDVLENGPSSPQASHFDIDWTASGEKSEQTVLEPILADQYGRVLEDGAIRVVRDGGAFAVRYAEHELPLSPRTVDQLLAAASRRAASDELGDLAAAFGALPHARLTDPEAVTARHAEKEMLRERLARLAHDDPRLAAAIDEEVAALNDDAEALDALLRRQNYRLASWRTASEELDYRRFFNIDSLVGLRTEDDAVFAETHAVVAALVRDGAVDGLRLDHVDGLRDPEGYLHRLRRATGAPFTVVEKILERGERLPDTWPVDGTSGYDFAARVDNLFVATDNESALPEIYARFTGETAPYDDVVQAAKHQIMREELTTEVERLTRLLAEICDGHRRQRDHTRRDLRTAVREVLAGFDVYRTYVQPDRGVSDADRSCVRHAVDSAHRRAPDVDRELLGFIGELLLLEHAGGLETDFALRVQQVSASVMAKGVEDTAFFRYHRLVCLNEVGNDPGVFGRAIDDFHRETAEVAARWPSTMLTLSTHDTKRSADVRVRIALLSEMPEPWQALVTDLSSRADRYRAAGWPDANTEYLLYQTLVGAWPISPERVAAFLTKATREAKVHTSWVDPDPEYDAAVQAFAAGVLADTEFLAAVERFLAAHRIVELGRQTSLAQTALLLTCPGVPDIYQGAELWDLSLVDPDNRRSVDFDARARALAELDRAEVPPRLSLGDDEVGVWKLRLIARLLDHRRRRAALFEDAAYEPLPVEGEQADHVVAFGRGGLAVAVPRLIAGFGGPGAWGETRVAVPEGRWVDLLTGAPVIGGGVAVSTLFEDAPVAVLARETS